MFTTLRSRTAPHYCTATRSARVIEWSQSCCAVVLGWSGLVLLGSMCVGVGVAVLGGGGGGYCSGLTPDKKNDGRHVADTLSHPVFFRSQFVFQEVAPATREVVANIFSLGKIIPRISIYLFTYM